ncbi:hypothetical protein ACFX1X_044359 [Malus domestica]
MAPMIDALPTPTPPNPTRRQPLSTANQHFLSENSEEKALVSRKSDTDNELQPKTWRSSENPCYHTDNKFWS